MIKLYNYQKEAVDKLGSGSILCGGVGSGKSITSLYFYFTRICNGIIENGVTIKMKTPIDLYIITTAKKRDSFDWERECNNFMLSCDINNNIFGVNVKIDSWNNIKKYSDIKNAFFIFDEQRVVGYGTWAKTFIKIAKQNKWILLSATPGDTWTDYLPVFIANGFFKNKTEFLIKHVVFNSFVNYAKIDHYVNIDPLIKMREKVLVKMEYTTNDKRFHDLIYCSFDKRKYEFITKKRWDPYKNEPIQNASGYCSCLRRCTNGLSKINRLCNLLSEYKKIILFYNYDYELVYLKDQLTKRFINYSEYNGHKHESIPSGSKWIYLVQYSAGAEAWNCIETNCIVFYSLHYSYKIMEQASGRIDRANTPFDKLYYYLLITDTSIDNNIIKCLKNKKNFNETDFYFN